MKKPFLRFRLSSLLLAVTLVGALLALAMQHQEVLRLRAIADAHRWSRGSIDLAADNYRASVNDLAAAGGYVTKQVMLETAGQAQMTVTDGEGNLAAGPTADPRSSDSALSLGRLTIAADLIETTDSENNLLRALVQLAPGPSGGGTGGPCLFHVPKDRRFDQLFEMLILPGVYKRGESIDVFRLNGRTWKLTVK
jgi:hypothetical protein